jgi:hypothetical protein
MGHLICCKITLRVNGWVPPEPSPPPPLPPPPPPPWRPVPLVPSASKSSPPSSGAGRHAYRLLLLPLTAQAADARGRSASGTLLQQPRPARHKTLPQAGRAPPRTASPLCPPMTSRRGCGLLTGQMVDRLGSVSSPTKAPEQRGSLQNQSGHASGGKQEGLGGAGWTVATKVAITVAHPRPTCGCIQQVDRVQGDASIVLADVPADTRQYRQHGSMHTCCGICGTSLSAGPGHQNIAALSLCALLCAPAAAATPLRHQWPHLPHTMRRSAGSLGSHSARKAVR